MDIGLADIFNTEARGPVTKQENRGQPPGPAKPAAPHAKQHHKPEDEPFQPGLIKLARVARHTVALGKDHGPRNVCDPSLKLGVDEVGNPPEEQANRRDHRHTVADDKDGHALPAGKQTHGGGDAKQPAMESHATLPDLDDFDRIGEEMGRVIKQHIAEPSAEDHPKKHMVQKAVDGLRRERCCRMRSLTPQDPVTGKQSAYIGKRIPANAKAVAEFDQEFVELRKDDGPGHGASLLVVGWLCCAAWSQYRIRRPRGIGKHGKMP